MTGKVSNRESISSVLAATGVLLSLLVLSGPPAAAQLREPRFPADQTVVPSELITIDRHGLYPKRIIRPEGPFVLFLENRSANLDEEFPVHPDKAQGALFQLKTHKHKAYDYKLIDLAPGTYQFRVKGKPTQVLEIVIESR